MDPRMGMAYDSVSEMTPTPEKALKATGEPNQMRPRAIWMAIDSIMALRGRSSVGWTLLHHLEPGMAPSRAKAQVQRDAAVVQATPQRMASTMSGSRRAMAAPEEPTALLMMVGVGWASSTSSEMSGSTNMRGIRNSRPPMVLMTMVMTMALGTWVDGCSTSSVMLMIMPVDDVA